MHNEICCASPSDWVPTRIQKRQASCQRKKTKNKLAFAECNKETAGKLLSRSMPNMKTHKCDVRKLYEYEIQEDFAYEQRHPLQHCKSLLRKYQPINIQKFHFEANIYLEKMLTLSSTRLHVSTQNP